MNEPRINQAALLRLLENLIQINKVCEPGFGQHHYASSGSIDH